MRVYYALLPLLVAVRAQRWGGATAVRAQQWGGATAADAQQWAAATCVGGIDIVTNGVAEQWGVVTAASGGSGVRANGSTLSLVYDERAYIVRSCENEARFAPSMYATRMPLLGKRLSFTVNISSAGCGCNVALCVAPACAAQPPLRGAPLTPPLRRSSQIRCFDARSRRAGRPVSLKWW